MKGNKDHMNLTGHRTFIWFIHQFLVNTYSTQKLGGSKTAKKNEKCREKWSLAQSWEAGYLYSAAGFLHD